MPLNHDILFYAFRYALGRRTYAVNDVVNAIKEHAKEIQPSTRELMVKEISDHLNGKYDDEFTILWNQAREVLNAA